MHVDISATKTCWFGESEKLIKEVFENYRRLCGQSKMKPILLFNEADAVFSKRKDANSSNVAQTENAIQNIILEEMERLDGILIATTNMADNLDKAFERRFLFKIRFDKPNLEAKSGIWLDKLPALRETEARQLASRFDLSGGEIDNVVRKATMEEILQVRGRAHRERRAGHRLQQVNCHKKPSLLSNNKRNITTKQQKTWQKQRKNRPKCCGLSIIIVTLRMEVPPARAASGH